jgi:gamma-glutamyltranspeptidase/glutathione hydrolase
MSSSKEVSSGTMTLQPVVTNQGLVCSPSPIAAGIGVRVLREGGNAFDAAVAVASAECITQTPMAGLGGEMFALLYEASTKKLYGLSGSGRAPQAASREYFTSLGYEKMPLDGPLSASVPGEVHAWQTILERFGSMPLGDLLQPAIEIAENGTPILPLMARHYTQQLSKLIQFPLTAKLLTDDGTPLQSGHIVAQRGLAESLRRIATKGADEFYKGHLGKQFVDEIRSAGGIITVDDMARQATIIYESPPSTIYRGHQIFTTALPSQGYLLLELLNILETFDIKTMGHNSPESIHAFVEAIKLIFADRLAYVGDPDFINVPIADLISKTFAQMRSNNINPDQANNEVAPGILSQNIDEGAKNTSYFCVVDKLGNGASVIHSLSNAFGSGFIAGDTGIMLNNRIGRGFSLQKNHPNVIEGGKKTVNTIQAYMIFEKNGSMILGGTPGGDNQAQFNAQVIANLLDYDMDVQTAVTAPRWTLFPGTDPANIERPYEIRIEAGIPERSSEALRSKGHRVNQMSVTGVSGAEQVIRIDFETGARSGGGDPRIDGIPTPE